jgi:hypothetical protein
VVAFAVVIIFVSMAATAEASPSEVVANTDSSCLELCYCCCEKLAPFKCSMCHSVSYCSRECQVEDYKKNGHKACCGLLCFPPEKVESMKAGCLMDKSDLKSYSPMLCVETVWVRARVLFNENKNEVALKSMKLALTIFEKYSRGLLHIDVIMLAEMHRDAAEIIVKPYPTNSLHIDNYTEALVAYSEAKKHCDICINTYIKLLLPYLVPPVEGKPHYHPDLPIDERVELIDRIEDCRQEATETLALASQGELFIASMTKRPISN